jgi:hypothetical protein
MKIDISLLETLANIAEVGGRVDYYSGNTADNVTNYIAWACSFEKEHLMTDWDYGCPDYNDELYKFTIHEIKKSAELYGHTYDKSKIK